MSDYRDEGVWKNTLHLEKRGAYPYWDYVVRCHEEKAVETGEYHLLEIVHVATTQGKGFMPSVVSRMFPHGLAQNGDAVLGFDEEARQRAIEVGKALIASEDAKMKSMLNRSAS